jgi:hypothetical protein
VDAAKPLVSEPSLRDAISWVECRIDRRSADRIELALMLMRRIASCEAAVLVNDSVAVT